MSSRRALLVNWLGNRASAAASTAHLSARLRWRSWHGEQAAPFTICCCCPPANPGRRADPPSRARAPSGDGTPAAFDRRRARLRPGRAHRDPRGPSTVDTLREHRQEQPDRTGSDHRSGPMGMTCRGIEAWLSCCGWHAVVCWREGPRQPGQFPCGRTRRSPWHLPLRSGHLFPTARLRAGGRHCPMVGPRSPAILPATAPLGAPSNGHPQAAKGPSSMAWKTSRHSTSPSSTPSTSRRSSARHRCFGHEQPQTKALASSVHRRIVAGFRHERDAHRGRGDNGEWIIVDCGAAVDARDAARHPPVLPASKRSGVATGGSG